MHTVWRIIQQRSHSVVGLLGALMVSAIAPQGPASFAAQLGDGSTVFTSPPRLVSFITTDNEAGRKHATYYVTVDLLPEAEEPLKTLKVTLIEGRFTRLDYHTESIEIFAGDRDNRGETYSVEFAEYEEASQTLTIQLVEAALPGQTLTFALKPVRNPTREGVYLFEITAAPDGNNPVFQRVGTARLNIFRDPFFSFL